MMPGPVPSFSDPRSVELRVGHVAVVVSRLGSCHATKLPRVRSFAPFFRGIPLLSVVESDLYCQRTSPALTG